MISNSSSIALGHADFAQVALRGKKRLETPALDTIDKGGRRETVILQSKDGVEIQCLTTIDGTNDPLLTIATIFHLVLVTAVYPRKF